MLDRLIDAMSHKKNRHLALLAGGTVGLMAGGKATPLAMMASGLKGLEEEWQKAHPEHSGKLADRWRAALEFYDQTHQEPTNRVLHTVGIPMILGGFLGMLAWPRYTPLWWASNGSWTAGWALNFVGHGVFEKGAPAFADDPLSFVAGPAWDFIRLRDKLTGRAGRAGAPDEAPAPVEARAA